MLRTRELLCPTFELSEWGFVGCASLYVIVICALTTIFAVAQFWRHGEHCTLERAVMHVDCVLFPVYSVLDSISFVYWMCFLETVFCFMISSSFAL